MTFNPLRAVWWILGSLALCGILVGALLARK